MKAYRVNEVFYSLQGEGARAGTANVFVRFAGCNINCTKKTQGFDCDTEHEEGTQHTAEQIVNAIEKVDQGTCHWVIFTGGEPLLQLDRTLLEMLYDHGYNVALETNGTIPIPESWEPYIDYVACSPKKNAELLIDKADECRVVLPPGVEPPTVPELKAERYFLSPASKGNKLDAVAIAWAVKKCMEDPMWSLSVQQHKVWGIK